MNTASAFSTITPADLEIVLADVQARFPLPALNIEIGRGVSIYPGEPSLVLDAPHAETDLLVGGVWAKTVTSVGRLVESAKASIVDARATYQRHAQQDEITKIASRAVASIDALLAPLERACLDAIDAFDVAVPLEKMSEARAAQHAAQRSDVRGFLMGMSLPDRLDALLSTIADRSDEAQGDLAARASLELGAIATRAILGSEAIRAFVVIFTKASIAPEKFTRALAGKLGLRGARHVFQSATEAIGNTATAIAMPLLIARDERLAALK